MIPFDLELYKKGRPVITQGGLPVRILAYNALTSIEGLDHPIIGLIQINSTREIVGSWDLMGKTGSWVGKNGPCKRDLFHPEEEMYVNVYNGSDSGGSFAGVIYNNPNIGHIKWGTITPIGTYKLVKVK